MSTPSTEKQNIPVTDAQTTNNEQSTNNDNNANSEQTQQQQQQRQQQPQPQSTWQSIMQLMFRIILIYYVVSMFKGKFRLNYQ